MQRVVAVLAITILCGCASLPRGETTYQALHAMDMLQTLNGPAGDPCYTETGAIPNLLHGDNPSRREVVAWGVGWGLLHWGVSRELEQHAPDWMLTAWQALTIGEVAITIGHNHDIGIRPWGDNKPANCVL